jgi:hypothetical protein
MVLRLVVAGFGVPAAVVPALIFGAGIGGEGDLDAADAGSQAPVLEGNRQAPPLLMLALA